MTKNTTSGLFKSFYRLSLAPGGNLPKIIFSLKHNFMIYDVSLDFLEKNKFILNSLQMLNLNNKDLKTRKNGIYWIGSWL